MINKIDKLDDFANKPPELEDSELIFHIKTNNDSDCLKELAKRHEGLFRNICNKYEPYIENSGEHFSDIVDSKEYIVFKAVESFNPEKGLKFSSWLGNVTRYECLNTISRKCTNNIPTELDTLNVMMDQSCLSKHEEIFDQKANQSMVDNAINILNELEDKRIIKIISQRTLEYPVKKWNDIKDEMGISRQTAINLYNKGIKLLKEHQETISC